MLLYDEITKYLEEHSRADMNEVVEYFDVPHEDIKFTYEYVKKKLANKVKGGFDIRAKKSIKVSAAWMSKQVDCTLPHILSSCGGGCCSHPQFWPPNSFPDNKCGFCGPEGCVLEFKDRPVTCMLFPAVLNDSGTFIMYQRVMFKHNVCKDAYGKGPTIIEGQAFAFTEIFGTEQYERVLRDVLAGKDSFFEVPDDIAVAFEREVECDNRCIRPIPRSQYSKEV